MSSPLNTTNKQNWVNHHDTFDCSISFQQKTPVFKKTRAVGKLTSRQQPKYPVQILDQLILLKHTQNLSNSELFNQFEEIVQSLLQKNDTLIAKNSQLQKQNTHLKQQVERLQHQIHLLHKLPTSTGNFSIMKYFDNILEFPITKPLDGNPYGLLEKTLQMCKNDNNSNIRAFYLSMLQFNQTRHLLQTLVSEFSSDDDSKLVPLLCTNEGWVQLVDNFFQVIQSNQLQSLQDVYDLLNISQLYDLIFISALRFRVNYEASDYDSEIDTMRLYTAFGNIFEDVEFNRKPHVNYDTYNFRIKETEFTIYYIEDLNQYAVIITEPQQHFNSSVQSYSAETSNQKSIVEYSIDEESDVYNIESRVVMDHNQDQ